MNERSRPAARCVALILAAGSGARLAMDRPKAFVPLAGRALLGWSLSAFAQHRDVTDLLVVVPPGSENRVRQDVLDPLAGLMGAALRKVWGVVPGGERRQDSARRGLEAACEILPVGTSALVLVHDAARPLVPWDLISRVIERLREGPEKAGGADEARLGVVPVLPVTDTLKEVRWSTEAIGQVACTIARNQLWRAQTPQGFDLRSLLEAHRAAQKVGFEATDDAMLYEWLGWRVEAVPGSPENLKITDAADLEWAETRLARKLAGDE